MRGCGVRQCRKGIATVRTGSEQLQGELLLACTNELGKGLDFARVGCVKNKVEAA